MLTQSAKLRRSIALQNIATPKPKVLEIGAFDNATFHPSLGDDVRYLDFFSTDELREMHKNNPRRRHDALVDIDYVVKSHHFAPVIDQKFDLIVANHVIEHIPDTIYWLRQLAALLVDTGRIFLSVPDRRYTFDYFRKETRATEMLRAHREKLDKPGLWQLLDHFYYHQKVDLQAIWAGRLPQTFKPRFSLAKALQMAEAQCVTYTDAHCWVFTSDSFQDCMKDLLSAEATTLGVTMLQEARPDTNEFHVVLGKVQAFDPDPLPSSLPDAPAEV